MMMMTVFFNSMTFCSNFSHFSFLTFRAFQSGFELEPVMCQTINTYFDKNYCPWVSCGEWCLTKTSGFCPQIHATSRRNGTDIQLENCTRITTTSCPEVSIYCTNAYTSLTRHTRHTHTHSQVKSEVCSECSKRLCVCVCNDLVHLNVFFSHL